MKEEKAQPDIATEPEEEPQLPPIAPEEHKDQPGTVDEPVPAEEEG